MATSRSKSTTPARRRRTTKASAKRGAASTSASVEGVEPITDVLDAEVRIRVAGSTVVAVAILVVLLVLTAAASVNWLYAIVTIALATIAGWLLQRSRD